MKKEPVVKKELLLKTIIGLATQLHSIATGNMTPSYNVVKGEVRPEYMYIVDTSEFAAGKLMDRGSLTIAAYNLCYDAGWNSL